MPAGSIRIARLASPVALIATPAPGRARTTGSVAEAPPVPVRLPYPLKVYLACVKLAQPIPGGRTSLCALRLVVARSSHPNRYPTTGNHMALNTARFSGHQSFTLRNTWLTKGVLGCTAVPSLFGKPDALISLGVGKNMVDSIRYWCLATRVIQESPSLRGAYEPTTLGRRLFRDDSHDPWDPYLEDIGSLWLLHWLLATNAEYATTPYYAFNELSSPEFTRDALEHDIRQLAGSLNARATDNTVKRDVAVFIRTYLGGSDRMDSSPEDGWDSPLAELGLLREEQHTQTYSLSRGHRPDLPDAVLVYALCQYAQTRAGRSTFTFDELSYRPRSPGRVFRLDDLALAERLERIDAATDAAWQFTETAGYRQLLVTRPLEPMDVLEGYYRAQSCGTTHAA